MRIGHVPTGKVCGEARKAEVDLRTRPKEDRRSVKPVRSVVPGIRISAREGRKYAEQNY